jgi:phage/plasmid-associated DNA primase
MEIPKTEFKSIGEIRTFLKMNKTDYANYYVNLMKDDIKIIGKEQDVYFYDDKIKLWKCETKEVYDAWMADYLNTTGKSLMKCYNKLLADCDDDDNDDESAKLKQSIRNKQNDFDSQGYISTVITRSTGKLQDNQFVTKLNAAADFLPIKDGKKVDLRTGEVTNRTKLDYFSYECPVSITDKLDNAEKFFKQVMPKDELREYLRKILGYCLTGNMDARCFFIWYGDGSNGKSVIMKLLKCILGPLYHQCGKGIFMKGSQEKNDGPSPDKVALIGVRNGVYSEGETADNIDINESFMKMVSGKDEINARALFRAPLTFFPVCKLHLLTNYKPDVNGDKSMKERIRYVFLNSSFVDNPDKKKRTNLRKMMIL